MCKTGILTSLDNPSGEPPEVRLVGINSICEMELGLNTAQENHVRNIPNPDGGKVPCWRSLHSYFLRVALKSVRCRGLFRTAECFTGTVTRVVDDDTLDIGNVKISLAQVNTRGRSDLGYSEVRVCRIVVTGWRDRACRSGRLTGWVRIDGMVAKVFCCDRILNKELLYVGHAGVYIQYCSVSQFASESCSRIRMLAQYDWNLFSNMSFFYGVKKLVNIFWHCFYPSDNVDRRIR